MEENGDDTKLLDAARAGDVRALEALISEHQGQVYRFGMAMCRDPEDAKDVLQETLLAMARNVRDFRGASSVSTWLYTIARSFCIKKRRRSKFAKGPERSLDSELDGGAHLVDPKKSPDEALAQKQVESALAEAIGALDPKYREVLVLRDVEGLSAPEVAEIVGLSVDAVKSRLHRARLAVRSHVAPLLGMPSDAGPPAPESSCPDVVTLLSQHLEGEIGPEACAEMERHVERCARCRGACESLKRTLALCRTTPRGPVPEDIQRSVRHAIRALLDAPPAR